MKLFDSYQTLHPGIRILLIAIIAVVAHFLVRWIRLSMQYLFTRKLPAETPSQENFMRRFPKLASVITILVSALTFAIYFIAVGLVLRECKISLTAYLASATVIGLAIGFGLQGFVQDVVIGLTLIFTDALNMEDMVEISGQVGRVERIGLRFTTLINLYGQKIYIPNRNIAMIGRFRDGGIRAYVDVQIPDLPDVQTISREIMNVAKGMQKQYSVILLKSPTISDLQNASPGSWRFIRIQFRLWPGQQALIETSFKQRVIVLMRSFYPEFADWMVTTTFRTTEKNL